jgi:hypothetical protein
MAKVTKTEITIRTMNDNADKPMAEVVLLIAEANGVTEAVAKGAYRWCVNKGVASGKIESNRGVTDAKLIKQVKLEGRQYKAKLKAKTKEVPAASLLPRAEVAKIKAANLKRMKEVSAKYGVGRTARPEGDGVADFDASEARAEVATMLEDDFAVPKFLSKDQVKAMI